MAVWKQVTKLPWNGSTPMICWVNLDGLDTVEPLSGGSRLCWHKTSPRCEWRIKERPEELMT